MSKPSVHNSDIVEELIFSKKTFSSGLISSQKKKAILDMANEIKTEHDIKLFKHSSFYSPVHYREAFGLGFKKKYINNKKTSLVWITTQISTIQLVLNIAYILLKHTLSNTATSENTFAWFFPHITSSSGFFSRFASSRTILAKTLTYNLFSNVVKFVLVGYNYTASYEKGILSLAVGYSHFCAFLIPHGVFVKILNKRNIRLYSYDFLLLTKTASFLAKLKKVSSFTGKGLLRGDRPFKLKKRSGN